jgi:hypothetical protein
LYNHKTNAHQYEKDPVSDGSTNLLCIKQFIPKKRRAAAKRRNFCFVVFGSFIFFKASFTLGLESFVEIWDGKRL